MNQQKIKEAFKNFNYIGNSTIINFLKENKQIDSECEGILSKYPRYQCKENIIYFLLKNLQLKNCKHCRKTIINFTD